MSDNVISRSNLIDTIYHEIGTTKQQASNLFDSVLEAIIEELNEKDEVKIAKFGAFTRKFRPARQARNPRTGEMVDVAESYTVSFKPAKTLKDSVENAPLVKAA